jgi:hypothetical protein
MWAVLCGYFWPVVFENQVLLPYDLLYTIEPWRSEMADIAASRGLQGVRNIQSADALLGSLPLAQTAQKQLLQGHIPLWNPDTLTGFPTGAFLAPYPFQYLALWLWPADQALSKLVVFHALLLSLFTYLLVIALDAHKLAGLVAGLVAVLNGMVIFHLVAPGMLSATAWALCPFWLFIRFKEQCRWRWSIVAGLCYGMFLLAGNLQLPFYASLAYGVYLTYWVGVELWRRNPRRALTYVLHSTLMVLIGVLIGSPYLLVNYQLFPDASRGLASLTAFTQPAWWIRLIVPNYFGDIPTANITPGVSFKTRVYVGIAPLILSLVSLAYARKPEARLFFLLAFGLIGVTLLWPPFSTLFYLVISPTIRLEHDRVLIIASLLLAVCAGLGFDAIIWLRSARNAAMVMLGLLVVILVGLLLISLPQTTSPDSVPSQAFRIKAIALSAGAALCSLVALLAWQTPYVRFGKALLISVIVVDLGTTFWRYQPAFPSDLMVPTPLIERLAARVYQSPVVPARVYQVGLSGPMAHLLEYYGIPDIAGYTSLPLARYNLYTFGSGARLQTGEKYWTLVMAITQTRARLFDALGAEYVLLPRDTVVEQDTLTQLVPKLPRRKLKLSADTATVLDNPASDTLPLTIAVPNHGRSYLMTGIALQKGFVHYNILVNGSPIESNALNQGGEIAFGKPLTVNLTPYAGQTVSVQLQAEAAPGARWGWVDPQLHFNPDGSPLLLLDAGGMLVYQNTQAYPRAWLVHSSVIVAPGDLEAALAKVADPTLDLKQQAVVENSHALELGAPQPSDSAQITRYEPMRMTIKVATGAASLLVVPDVYNSIWRATLDGAPVTVYPTNLTMRGVQVPAGEHTVELFYDTSAFNTALWISASVALGGLLALGLALLYDLKLRSRIGDSNRHVGVDEDQTYA